MTIQSFAALHPNIAENVFIDETAVVIGDVHIGADTSIWPLTVLRGDVNTIIIGQRTSIQDGSIVHVTHRGIYHPDGYATVIGDDVTVGHRVILHGCNISDRCLIGMGSCIMDGAIIESEVVLAAGSLVPPGKILQGGHLWLGTPVRCIRKLTDQETEHLLYSANQYVKLKNQYLSHS